MMKKEEGKKFPPRSYNVLEKKIWPFSHDLGTRQWRKVGKWC